MRKRRLPEVAVFGFLLPNFLGFCAFLLLPILLSLGMSLTNWSLKPSQDLELVGLRNFTDLLGFRAIGGGNASLAAGYAASAVGLLVGLVATLWANVAAWRGLKLGGVVLAALGAGVLVGCFAAGGGAGLVIAGAIALLGGIAATRREDGTWAPGLGALGPLLLAAAAAGLWMLQGPMWAGYELRDPRFWQFFHNTLFLMMGIPLSIAGSLALAMLLNEALPLGPWRNRAFGTVLCLFCGAVSMAILWNLGKTWRFDAGDVRNPAALTARLRKGEDGLSGYIAAQHAGGDIAQPAALIAALNRALDDPQLYRAEWFPKDKITHRARRVLRQYPDPHGEQVRHRNRRLLEYTYSEALAPCRHTGYPNLALLAGILWLMAAIGMAFNIVSFRTLFYLPTFTAGVALMVLWMALYNPKTGPINQSLDAVLHWFGHGPAQIEAMLPKWLGDVHWSKPALIIMAVWTTIGGTNMLLYLAGLSNVPPQLLDAAQVDGAGWWAKFRHVIWPQLAPTTFFISVMSIIGGLQGGFEQARVMTEGGPAGSTTTLSYYIYNKFFQDLDLGYAAAISWILFGFIFVATAINWRFGRELEVVE